MKYLSVPQTAERWCISARRLQILCNKDRIPGAVKIGTRWAIPDDVPKPADARIKSGKYNQTEARGISRAAEKQQRLRLKMIKPVRKDSRNAS